MAETEVIPNDLNTDPVPGLQSEQNEVLTTAVHSITSAVQTVEVSEPAVSFMAADGAAEVEEDGSALQSIDMSGQALFIVTPDGQQIQLSPQQAAAFVSQQANGHFIMETGGDQDVEMQEQSDCDVKDDHLESVEHDHSQEDLGVVDMNKDNSFAVHDQKSDQSSSCLVPQSSVILEQGPGIAEAVPGSSAGMSLLNMGTQGVQGMIINPSSISQIRTSEGETIQVIAVQNADQLLPGGSRLVQLVPGGMLTSVSDGTSLVALGQPTDVTTQGMQAINTVVDSNTGAQSLSFATSAVPGSNTLSGTFIAPTAPPPKTLLIRSSGAPGWACRMNDCEKIGDSYRGWVETEVQLDLLLTYHKQQTQSFWGTRQSPSPAKQSTRLMWKSQYAPFDGIPFVNSGSRAIVLECQYGPRRKGAHLKKQEIDNPNIDYKQTCPARIYIKKVKKFPEYAVNIQIDKKILKSNMDKSFEILRKRGVSGHGQERFYVQLPTEKAHEFHGESEPEWFPHRLHPAVANKIREYVSCGETRLYAIRKMLRRYVEKELFGQMDGAPEKHNLSYFPTVNDLQNHIHQAVKDVETGELPLAAQTVNLEVVNEGSEAEQNLNDSLWQQSSEEPHAETVTVTLTQNPNEDGQHLISRVETHLSDGSTVVSSSLTPETAKLLSRLHPNMFPTNILQQEVQPEDTDTDLSASISMETDMTVGSEESCSVVMPQVVDPEAGTIMIKTDDCAVLPGDNDVCGVLTLVQQDGQVALQVLSSSDQNAHVGLGEGGHLEDDQIVGVLDAGGVSLVKTEVQDEVEQLPTVLM